MHGKNLLDIINILF